VVESSPTGELTAAEQSDLETATQEAVKAQERHRDHLLRRIERIRVYAEMRDCRRQYLLDYFGEESEPCGRCDNCERGLPEQKSAVEGRPFPSKTRVVHKQWGKGVVMGYEGDHITIMFDELGEKVLSAEFALSHELLDRAQ
jgi:ATP-dependent DNA helicase RecQ